VCLLHGTEWVNKTDYFSFFKRLTAILSVFVPPLPPQREKAKCYTTLEQQVKLQSCCVNFNPEVFILQTIRHIVQMSVEFQKLICYPTL